MNNKLKLETIEFFGDDYEIYEDKPENNRFIYQYQLGLFFDLTATDRIKDKLILELKELEKANPKKIPSQPYDLSVPPEEFTFCNMVLKTNNNEKLLKISVGLTKEESSTKVKDILYKLQYDTDKN